MILDVVSAALIALGCVFFAAGTVGLLRFADLNTRLHALAKADNVGLGFVVAGLLAQADHPAIAAKLVLIWALALFAAATNGHLLARAETTEGDA